MTFKIDHTFTVLENALNGSTARQKAIADNISNINTPGFKRYLVNFEDQLANPQGESQQLPLKVTEEKQISNTANETADMERDTSPGLRADGNNVDLEKEMTLMVQNNVYYNAALNQVNKKIAMLKYVISDGRG